MDGLDKPSEAQVSGNHVDTLIAGSAWWLNALGKKYGFLSKEFSEALRLTQETFNGLIKSAQSGTREDNQ